MTLPLLLRSPLVAMFTAAVALSVAATRPHAEPVPKDAAPCDTSHLSAMIGQMIMVGFLGNNEKDAGVIAARRQLADGVIGGVVLFPENIGPPNKLKALTAYLRDARSNPVPFIAVDEEGGKVQRLDGRNGYRHFPSAASVGRNPSYASPQAAERLYAKMAAQLAEVGFNMNLGPVVDLNLNPRNPVIGARDRSFSADPDVVTALATAFIEAHRRANIVTVAKHFPGHGSSTTDSHKTLADISKTWRPIEIEPYQRLAKAGLLDGVMIGHLYQPRFSDMEGMPASLSAKAVRALRDKSWIDFDGVIISDDMEMGAVRDMFPPDELAVRAVNAGIDIVMFSNIKSHDPELGLKIHTGLLKAVCDGRISRIRIEKAYGKILLLKRRLEQKDLTGKW